MFENTLEIDINGIQEPMSVIKFQFSWQERDLLIQQINEYIKDKRLDKSILLTSLSYQIIWDNEDSFKAFIKDDRYLNILKKLKDFNINVNWL